MKKALAIVLASAMAISTLAACGSGSADQTTAAPSETESEAVETEASKADETVAVNEDADASAYKIAMVTDYGDITDQSFNQTTYEACKAFAEANSIDFTYFKPVSDSDQDRVAMIESAIDAGYNVIVMPGYAFANAIKETAEYYPDVDFIALDVSEGDFGSDYVLPENLYSAVYHEELSGYMAGYAAVKLGYKKLGFLGGMAVPAVVRFGYGFVQGADAAAAELELTDVEVKYVYGNQFYGDADITAYMDTWYGDGTEVVFACGGGIFTSAAEAAAKTGGKVIGVDVDQAATIDGMTSEGMTLTSATKGLAATVNTMLAVTINGDFANYGGKIDVLGIVSDDPAQNYVALADSTQWNDGFTEDDYKELVKAMNAGEVTVDNSVDTNASDYATVITVDEQGTIKG